MITNELSLQLTASRPQSEVRNPQKSDSDGSYDLTSSGLQERGDQDMRKRRDHDAGFKAL